MNSRLPLEILIQIFYYLHYEQKQQCKFVCRSWANACRLSNIDIETLLFKRDSADMIALHNYFTIKPEMKAVIGGNCRRIVCSNHHTVFYVAYNFPNLRVLCLFPEVAERISDRNQVPALSSYYINLLKHWYRHLEILMITECPLFIATLLKSGTFYQLKKLSVVLFRNRMLNNLSFMINELTHAPQLQVLHLHNAIINVTDLENIHKNAPRLVSLKLIKCDVLSDQELRESFEPALTMKRFEVYRCYINNTVMRRLISYIPIKYPRLQEFYNINQFLEFASFECSRTIVSVVSASIAEKNLCSSIQPQQAIVPNGHATTSVSTTTLADSLESLGLDVYFKSDLLLRELYESDLFLNLKSLSLINVPPISFRIFKNYHKLKTLELSFRKYDFFLVELNTITRDLPPQLDTFGLTFTKVYLDPKTAWTHSNIKWLKFESSEIQSNLGGYLSMHFPKLNSLSLIHCISKFGFHLPRRSFLFVDIISRRYLDLTIDEGRGKRNRTQYMCHIDSHFERFHTRSREDLFHRHDNAIYPILKPSVDVFLSDPSFGFSCASVQTLLYNGYLIL